MASALPVTPVVEVFPSAGYADAAAARIVDRLPSGGSLVLTGGSTAQAVYRRIEVPTLGAGPADVLFSDERCVPPDDERSNFRMARGLLERFSAVRVYRMQGEDPPAQEELRYSEVIRPVADTGFDLVLLGMGGDAHVCALFPGSDALEEDELLCRAVERPDGLRGLTLTPPAIARARRVLLLVTGRTKAEAVRRVLRGDEPIESCPARVVTALPDVTFLLDEGAGALL
ncbi:MAG: 6-phosphogluconolactonase [Actinomycetota bacterium]